MSTLLSPEAQDIICFYSKLEKATSGLLHVNLQLPPTLTNMVRGALYLCAFAQTLTRLFNKCAQWSDMPMCGVSSTNEDLLPSQLFSACCSPDMLVCYFCNSQVIGQC